MAAHAVAPAWLFVLLIATAASAQIRNWQTGETIAGTEQIQPGPQLSLVNWNTPERNLRYADLPNQNLGNSDFSGSWLDQAHLQGADLTRAQLRGTSLVGADLSGAILRAAFIRQANFSQANLRNAVLSRVNLSTTQFDGADLEDADISRSAIGNALKPEQFYQTATYRQKDLRGMNFQPADLHGWNFQDQDLTGANLLSTSLIDANLAGANLTDTRLAFSQLAGANFRNAIIQRTEFGNRLTVEQLRSTASFQSGQLQGVGLYNADLQGVDFSGHDLTGANLRGATLTTASFANANLTRANLSEATLTSTSFRNATISLSQLGPVSLQQLSETANFAAKELAQIGLSRSQLAAGQFSDFNMFRTNLQQSDLSGSDLQRANLSSADLRDARLTQANFSEANLANVDLRRSDLGSADLRGANLVNSDLRGVTNLTTAIFSAATQVSQWTIFPDGFDSAALELTRITTPLGDLNGDQAINAEDVDLLARVRRYPDEAAGNKNRFDLDGDGDLFEEHHVWVTDLRRTWYGDANLDGVFQSDDFVQIFQFGQYEDALVENSGWASGDWNGDGEFNSSDFVIAFNHGGFEQGPLPVRNVPEPSGTSVGLLAFAVAQLAVGVSHGWNGRGCFVRTRTVR